RLCLRADTDYDYAALSGANRDSYGLAFCGAPPGEPTCVPQRLGAFDGPAAGDADGDGVPDADDLCPAVFDPVRPIDGGGQADSDGDDVGDACDPCPLQADTEDCAPIDLDDLDGDDIDNVDDNCPDDANPEQEDADGDGLGDVCDACPDESNLDGRACSVSVYDIKDGTVPSNTPAQVRGIITAVAPEGAGFFLQMAAGQPGYRGVPFSGVYVYTGNASVEVGAMRGQRVAVSGTASDFFGQRQIAQVSHFEVLEADVAVPAPVTVDPAMVRTDGALADDYEAVLVRVEQVDVLSVNPPAGPGDSDPTNAFVVTGGLRVNDFLYAMDTLPAVGSRFQAIVGVLRFANEDSKLEPRGPEDVADGPPVVVALEPARAFVRAGGDGLIRGLDGRLLSVRLSSAAEAGGLAIDIALDPQAPLVADGPTVVAEGATSALVALRLNGPVAEPLDVTVTASVPERGAAEAIVTVLPEDAPPTSLRFEPAEIVVGVDETVEVTLVADRPAPEDGWQVQLTPSDALSDLPRSVLIPWGEGQVTFEVTVASQATTGTLTGRLDDLEAELEITVVDAISGLVINEIDYDQPG
ncbi:MAG: hypothetical protein KC583_06775, partial [Myxococcales bacterium]|nr:hypothetical protein [Myxococcales bacterium]